MKFLAQPPNFLAKAIAFFPLIYPTTFDAAYFGGMLVSAITNYGYIHTGIVDLLESTSHAAMRSVNALMTATYWEIGRRIVEFEQGGVERAEYGEVLIQNLAQDLTIQFNRGFSRQNIQQMRAFYIACQNVSFKLLICRISSISIGLLMEKNNVNRKIGLQCIILN